VETASTSSLSGIGSREKKTLGATLSWVATRWLLQMFPFLHVMEPAAVYCTAPWIISDQGDTRAEIQQWDDSKLLKFG